MSEKIPTKPSAICEHCHKPVEYAENPMWESLKHLFTTDHMIQKMYWLPVGHEGCSDALERKEDQEKEAKRRKLEREDTKRNLRELGFSQFTKDENVQAFQLHDGVKAAYDAIQNWTFQKKGILLIGPPGRGKSHLTASLGARFTSDTELSAAFTTMSSLLALLRRGYDEDLFDERLRMASSDVHILIIDDLGVEHETEWGEEKLYMILETRLNHTREPRPLFVTTNLTRNELSERYHPRIISRLHEMCTWIEVSGPDFRNLKPVPTVSPPLDAASAPQEPRIETQEKKSDPGLQASAQAAGQKAQKNQLSQRVSSPMQPELPIDFHSKLFKDDFFDQN